MSAAQLLISWPLDCTAQVSPERESLSTTRLPLLRNCITVDPVTPASDIVVPSLVSEAQRRHASPPDHAANRHPAAASGCAAVPLVPWVRVVVGEPLSATSTSPDVPATMKAVPLDAACWIAGEVAAGVPARLTVVPAR